MKPIRILRALCFMALFSAPLARAEEEAAKVVTFKELAVANHKEGKPPEIPADLKKLEGKKVRVTGFIAPYDDPEKMKKLLLTGAALGCFYCNPPQENEVVFVRLPAKADAVTWETDHITVEGTLHFMGHDKKDAEAEQFLFTVDEAKVVK